MEFSSQEHWSGLPCPPPGVLPAPGIKPAFLMYPALAGGFFTTSATWEARPPPLQVPGAQGCGCLSSGSVQRLVLWDRAGGRAGEALGQSWSPWGTVCPALS